MSRITGVWEDIATKLGRRRALAWGMALVLAVLVLAAYLYGRSQTPAVVSEGDNEGAALYVKDRENVALYAEAFDAVREDYIKQEDIDSKEQTYDAIRGMLDSLGDKEHMRFLTPEEVEKTRKVLSSKRIGIGTRLEDRGDEVVVASPVEGSPAEEAGIESGDVIVAVNREGVQGENVIGVTEKLEEGPEGSRVDLTVLRDGEEREFSLERAEFKVPAASWNLIPGTDVAHLRLALFSDNSAVELEGAILGARKAGARRFVLDLRNNRGGRVKQTEKIAAQFLPAGSEIYTRKGVDGEEEEETVPDDNEPLEAPLVVLVDEESASGAEILASALRDNGRAEVVGGTTFGAGTVLDERVLSDGSAILLAVAEWLTPNGDFIQGNGIAPDVEARLEAGQEPRTPDEVRGLSREEIFAEDAQLERAFEAL